MTLTSGPIIEITDLRKTYGPKVVLDGLSLRVRRGEVFGVLGPNGAGKTTTVECAAGLRRPDSGTVRVLGLDPATDPDEVRHRVGVQLQHAVLPNRMKVREAMAVFACAYRHHADPDRLLDEWGLREQRRAAFGGLSGGQKQRLFIALALLGEPEIVVLDELTTGLDPAARRDTWALVRALRAQGVTVVLVTHAMNEAETLCDRLVVIDRGRIVAEGTPDAVRGEHRTLVTLDVDDDGVGFDGMPQVRADGGFGLVGMRERITAVGGELSVESAPGQGTTIAVSVPS